MRRKAGERLDKQARALRAERRHLIGWRYIPLVLAYCCFCSLFIVYLAWSSMPELAWMYAGFAGGASLLFLYIATGTVAASRLESASNAEFNTSREIRKLHRNGWRAVDNLPFHRFDVDHIAIGPGGIVVIETKWTSDGLADSKGRLNEYGDKAICQVTDNVRCVGTVLRQNGCHTPVHHACVVSWGKRTTGAPLTMPKQEVTVVDGDRLGAFLQDLDEVMSAAEIDTAFDALNEFLGFRLDHIARQGARKQAVVRA